MLTQNLVNVIDSVIIVTALWREREKSGAAYNNDCKCLLVAGICWCFVLVSRKAICYIVLVVIFDGDYGGTDDYVHIVTKDIFFYMGWLVD